MQNMMPGLFLLKCKKLYVLIQQPTEICCRLLQKYRDIEMCRYCRKMNPAEFVLRGFACIPFFNPAFDPLFLL